MIYLEASELLCFEGDQDLVIFMDKKFLEKVELEDKKICFYNKKVTFYFNKELEEHLLSLKNIKNYKEVFVHIEDGEKSEALKLNIQLNAPQ